MLLEVLRIHLEYLVETGAVEIIGKKENAYDHHNIKKNYLKCETYNFYCHLF